MNKKTRRRNERGKYNLELESAQSLIYLLTPTMRKLGNQRRRTERRVII